MARRIRQRIESAMALGAKCDEFRDRAFAEGDLEQGTFWGKRAIHYYTEAEKLSAELAANYV
jgi:hypothetical protein